jgi:hypothetical protein
VWVGWWRLRRMGLRSSWSWRREGETIWGLGLPGWRIGSISVAGRLASVWERVQPSEATVAFGLKVTGKSGRLTGLLVEGGGEASLTVTMKWTGLSKEEPVEAAGEG